MTSVIKSSFNDTLLKILANNQTIIFHSSTPENVTSACITYSINNISIVPIVIWYSCHLCVCV